jgi:pyridoxine kinase
MTTTGSSAAKPAVILVNSLVARGAVGGRAAVFVLERLGFAVWLVPTVLRSWHPGHGPATRIVSPPAEFQRLLADLAATRRLSEVGAILTGYLGDAAQVTSIVHLVQALKARNPGALLLCDPVIGDHGRLFQPEAIATAVRDRLVPLADIVTPNRFELEWCTGMATTDNAGLIDAARRLGRAEVVVTSAFAPPGDLGNLLIHGDQVHVAGHGALPSVPNGTGDLLAALYLAHRLADELPEEALLKSVSSTLRLAERAVELGADELPLAAAKDDLLSPPRGVSLSRL